MVASALLWIASLLQGVSANCSELQRISLEKSSVAWYSMAWHSMVWFASMFKWLLQSCFGLLACFSGASVTLASFKYSSGCFSFALDC